MKKTVFLILCSFFFIKIYAATEVELICKKNDATVLLKEGFDLQKDHNSEEALKKYQSCLKIESDCVSCLYEMGWSYWKLGEWNKVISTWESALVLSPTHSLILQFLPTARENLKIVESKNKIEVFRSKTEMLIQSEPKDAPVVMTMIGRWQAYNHDISNSLDHFDADIDSPKSANFTPNGEFVYVNSLEGGKTVIFKSLGLEKVGVIKHNFAGNENFFDNSLIFGYKFPKSIKKSNQFLGKPVESVFSHDGKYLWVTYYRRSFDIDSKYASAMALIETSTNKIIKVFGTGPIAKYVQVSSDSKFLAVSNWGDNTVGLYDISGDNPSHFKPLKNVVIESRYPESEMKGNRDKNCGFCIRGLAFTKDNKYLFVSRMKKGGISVINLSDKNKIEYLGTIKGIQPGTRDLQISSSGDFLYAGCNASGYISKIPVLEMLNLLMKEKKSEIVVNKKILPWKSVFAGLGVRSIKLTSDDKYLFAAVNQGSELHVYDAVEMKRISKIPVDSFPVGLALSPDGMQAWVTSQGRSLKGGNSVGIFQIQYKLNDHISSSKDPRLKTKEE